MGSEGTHSEGVKELGGPRVLRRRIRWKVDGHECLEGNSALQRAGGSPCDHNLGERAGRDLWLK